jgi:hypothetical protein
MPQKLQAPVADAERGGGDSAPCPRLGVDAMEYFNTSTYGVATDKTQPVLCMVEGQSQR